MKSEIVYIEAKMLGDILHVNMLGLSNSNSYRNTEDGIFSEFSVF